MGAHSPGEGASLALGKHLGANRSVRSATAPRAGSWTSLEQRGVHQQVSPSLAIDKLLEH